MQIEEVVTHTTLKDKRRSKVKKFVSLPKESQMNNIGVLFEE